ncbi:hypothetical protein FIM08_02550 [SAR202 cluster bacterium AC-647-N09_OGT_505m]|nr:hypothetical protein [SAR202 cluster bacterium AC-647-N09_OGT_505m]
MKTPMMSRINPLLGSPKNLLARFMTAAAIVTIVGACTGSEPQNLTFDLEIKNHQLNMGKLEAKQNDNLTLNIVGDEPGEFHIHGYGYEEKVSPGKTTKLIFKANATGKFNITFHTNGQHGEKEHKIYTNHSHEAEGICKASHEADGPTPEISVTAIPSDDPHHINIVATTENIVLTDAGDHWHLHVNGMFHGMYVEPEVTFDTRIIESPGEYLIMVSLNDAQHCDYGIQAMTKIVLEGEEPVDMKQDHGNRAEEVLIGSLEVQPR